MPPIKIDHIVSFSSEDPVHTANNILSTDTLKKWRCQSPGEKQAIVVLQLAKASQITAIDIGNENSAYVEVLVSRSSGSDEFKVILVTSAFMTPLEARQSQNVNKVRMFTKDQLSKPECDEKWDRVKIVCTQPFNKRIQFGLSFITLHSNVSKESETSGYVNIGKFVMRPESPDNLSAGVLFAKRKELSQEEKPTAAAAIRDATSSLSLALYGSPTCKPKLKNKDPNLTPKRKTALDSEESTPKNRNRNELFYTKDDEDSNEKIDKVIKRKEEEDSMNKEKDEKVAKKPKTFWGTDYPNTPKENTKKKKKNDDEEDERDTKKKRDTSPNSARKKDIEKINQNRLNSPTTSRKKEDKNTKRKNTEEEERERAKAKKPKRMKPFHELLQGVNLVISGIQNPDRANLRTMALTMGAKYKPDWDGTCTHLICAFSNTPKFNQVKGKGKIVTKSWIETCHKERKKLPWRRFALDKNDLGKNESEDEIHELLDPPSTTNSRKLPKYEVQVSDDNSEHKAEGSDTEERLARILSKKKGKKRPVKKVVNSDDSTDEESLNISKNIEYNVERPKMTKKKEESKKAQKSVSPDNSSDNTDEESLNVSLKAKNNKNKRGSPKDYKIDVRKAVADADTENREVGILVKKKEESKPEQKSVSPDNSSDDNTDEVSVNVALNSKNNNKTENPKCPNNSKRDVYEADTDEEILTSNVRSNRLLDVFHGEKFYVDQSFDEDTYNMLCRYIIAYNGKCMDDVTDDVGIIVTTKENSETLKEINQKAKCIDQEWILQTHSKHALIPIKNFVF